MAQQKEFSFAVTTTWQNIFTLMKADQVPLNPQTNNFAPILFINKGAVQVLIKSNGNNNNAPVASNGLTLEASGNVLSMFTYTEFNAHIAWIKTVSGTATVEAVGYVDSEPG